MRFATTVLFMILMISAWFCASYCFTNDKGFYGGSFIATSVVMAIGMIIRGIGAFERKAEENRWY